MVGADLVRDHDQVCLGDPGRFAPACPNISCTIRPVSVARVSADSSSHAGVATVTPRRFAAKQVELLRGARQMAHPLDPAFPSADRHGLLFDSGREKSVIRLKPARSIKRMDPLARATADHAMPTRPPH